MRREDIDLARPAGTDRPGDHWTCARLGQSDGCHFGPNHQGKCPLVEGCRPKRTWAGRRRQVAVAASLLLLGLAAFAVWSPAGTGLIKPGELTTQHAQILASTTMSDRCNACHSNASESMLGWLPGLNDSHTKATQTKLCLNCHQTTFADGTATLAHNLPSAVRDEIRLASVAGSSESNPSDQPAAWQWQDAMPTTAVAQDDIACGVCHREHKGPEHDLTTLTDAQCQSCHQDRFGDFGSTHPEFANWPYGRGGNIAFDHRSHLHKHFPETKHKGVAEEFRCEQCHTTSAEGTINRSVDYQMACAACHDESLQAEISSGLEMVSLPTLPAEIVSDVNNWPESATGFCDGKISPLAQLLLRGDQATATAMNKLADHDFSRLNPDDPQHQLAASKIAGELYRLLRQISAEGQPAVFNRLSKANSVSRTWQSMIQSFSPQLVDGALQQWFGRTDLAAIRAGRRRSQLPTIQMAKPAEDDLLGGDALLGEDALMEGDPLASDPLAEDPLMSSPQKKQSSSRFDADQMLSAGGWYRDDLRLAIRYQASQHADPVLKAAIEATAGLAHTDSARLGLTSTKAAAACLRCHASAADQVGSWKAENLEGNSDQFTKFSHSPHLNIASLSDCVACHQVRSKPKSKLTTQTAGHTNQNDFEPVQRTDCAKCHTKAAAGDSCVDCHRYHIDQR